MKRIMSLMIALTLICALIACGKKDETASNKKPDTSKTESTEFVKPENYASVLLVTINPQFKLYLDEAGNVLAVEAVNKDAQSMTDSISYENKNFETVLQEIVTTANEKGFIKEDATINLEIEETKSTTVNATEILNKATTAANQTATELEIKVTVKAEEVQTNTEEQTENIEEQPTTDSGSNTENSTDDNNNTSTPTETKPVHSHSYSAATCTAPQKCSCGATNGSALGHSYANGVCSRCKAKDPNFVSYTSVAQKNGRWSFKYVIGDVYYSASLTLYGSTDNYRVGLLLGDALSSFPPEEQEIMKADCIEFNGKLYYCARGTGDGLASVTESGTTVTVTDLSGNKLVLTRTGENSFKVQSSPTEFSELGKVPVGLVLTFVAN